MALTKNQRTGLLALGLVLGFMGWWFMLRKKNEHFTGANASRPSPVLNAAQSDYDMIQENPSSYDFANMVAPGQMPQRPLEQFEPSLPNPDSHVAAYDIDVADPMVHMFRPSIRVALKNRQQEGACPFRGDLPIQKNPAHKGWFNSRYSEGDNKLDGYFSAYTRAKIRGLTGEHLSYPMQVANEELIMDFY